MVNSKKIHVYRILAAAFLMLYSSNLTIGQSNQYMSIKDVVELTLQNNKDIAISKSSIDESIGNIQVSQAKFNTKLLLQASKDYLISPNTLDFRENLNGFGINPYSKSDILNYSFEINKKLKFGTEINPGLSLYNYGKDSLYNRLQNSGSSGLMTNRSNVYLNINQPLLLGFGKNYNTYEESIARKQYKISELSHYHIVAYKIYQSLTSFLNYIFANKNLDIQLEIEKRYETLIDQLGYLVDMDALPSADLKYVQAIIASQKAIQNESAYTLFSRKKEFGVLIGVSDKQLNSLLPPPNDFSVDAIQLFDTSGYLARCFSQSLVNRSDINATSYGIEQNEITINHIKKSIKQDLTLKLGVGYNGIFESAGLDQMYQPFVQNILGINYRVGLSLTINPKHDKEKGELVKALAGKEIEVSKRTLLISEMNASIESCLRQILAFNQIVANYKLAVNYNKEALDNEYTKLKLGTSTIINLIQLQINYNESLTDLYKAILNLNLSLISYRFLTGTLININSELSITVDYNDLFALPFLK